MFFQFKTGRSARVQDDAKQYISLSKHERSLSSQQHTGEVQVAPPMFASSDSHALRRMLVQKYVYPLYQGFVKPWNVVHQVVGSAFNERTQN